KRRRVKGVASSRRRRSVGMISIWRTERRDLKISFRSSTKSPTAMRTTATAANARTLPMSNMVTSHVDLDDLAHPKRSDADQNEPAEVLAADAVGHRFERVFDRHAEARFREDARELRRGRLDRFLCTRVQRLHESVPGLQGSRQELQRVRKLRQELAGSLRDAIREDHAR